MEIQVLLLLLNFQTTEDLLSLVHPVLAITVVFPLIGMVVGRAWLTRQRRLEIADGSKSKIPPVVGQEHLQLGKWLTSSVVGIALIGLAFPIFTEIVEKQLWSKIPFQITFIVLVFLATIASLVLLYRARPKVWRAIFATLTGIGLVVLGFQNGPDGYPFVYRRDDEWFLSHFYFGIVATLLMIFSLAIVQDIYQDRSNRWRIAHTILNCIAALLFIGQGMTGTRDLLEIPLSWQKPAIYQCNFDKNSPAFRTCPGTQPPAP
jgi:drug/metabolite transporter (DMT)-like permease